MQHNSDNIIKLADPGRENIAITSELDNIFKRVLNSGSYILGSEVVSFEKNFANYCGSKFCVTTGNGTDALTIALKASGCGRNDKIATIPTAGFYSTAAIKAIGAQPVYIDIKPETMSMSVDSLKEALDKEQDISCIIATHLYGAVNDIDKIAEISDTNNIVLIEDCSQAHGAKYNTKMAGTFGRAGIFSFYPTKNLGALGDGGAIITDSASVYDNAKRLRLYGWGEKYKVVTSNGQNSRLDELQAAILDLKLTKLDTLNECRKKIVQRYAASSFKNIEVFNFEGENFVAHLAIVKTKYRNQLRAFLLDNHISCDIHFPILDYQQPANLCDFSCDNAEQLVHEILTIPCYPSMPDEDVSRVITKLQEFDQNL